ncbi:uncharacterized protein LOC124283677 [Haliotis rubra]|uniref:uncharacterized protein LOC124283677 n=1 Tax=Haliotis rubra TaxID=36100 RepID=UPI001EE51FED|nr:uncharacterized protein LOC124283677 [Haliotis rubra]
MSDYSKMMKHIGGSGVMCCLSLARELGIVDVLVEAKQPLTSHQVADKLNLRERYVREILGSLSVGEVISVDDTSTEFRVPEGHKRTLVAMSVFSRIIPRFGMRYNKVKACAQQRNPGGKVMAYSHVEIYHLYDAQKIVCVCAFLFLDSSKSVKTFIMKHRGTSVFTMTEICRYVEIIKVHEIVITIVTEFNLLIMNNMTK